MVASALDLAIALPWLAAKDVPFSLVTGELGGVLVGTLGATGPLRGDRRRDRCAPAQPARGRRDHPRVDARGGEPFGQPPADVGRWLPLGAAAALMGADTGLLPMWAGGVLFTAYGVVIALAGARLVSARDVV